MPHFFRCPECGSEVERAVEHCPQCGVSFSGVVCTECGHRAPVAAFRSGVCPKCGAPVRTRSALPGCGAGVLTIGVCVALLLRLLV